MASRTPVHHRPLLALHRRVRPDAHQRPTTSTDLLVELTAVWWGTALVFYGLGDLFTTLIGLHTGTVVEASPVGIVLVTQFGPWVMVPLKLGLFAGFSLLWYVIPRPHNVGVPLALATIGVLVTTWNAFVLVFPLHG